MEEISASSVSLLKNDHLVNSDIQEEGDPTNFKTKKKKKKNNQKNEHDSLQMQVCYYVPLTNPLKHDWI